MGPQRHKLKSGLLDLVANIAMSHNGPQSHEGTKFSRGLLDLVANIAMSRKWGHKGTKAQSLGE
jgi:hypothetical protein